MKTLLVNLILLISAVFNYAFSQNKNETTKKVIHYGHKPGNFSEYPDQKRDFKILGELADIERKSQDVHFDVTGDILNRSNSDPIKAFAPYDYINGTKDFLEKNSWSNPRIAKEEVNKLYFGVIRQLWDTATNAFYNVQYNPVFYDSEVSDQFFWIFANEAGDFVDTTVYLYTTWFTPERNRIKDKILYNKINGERALIHYLKGYFELVEPNDCDDGTVTELFAEEYFTTILNVPDSPENRKYISEARLKENSIDSVTQKLFRFNQNGDTIYKEIETKHRMLGDLYQEREYFDSSGMQTYGYIYERRFNDRNQVESAISQTYNENLMVYQISRTESYVYNENYQLIEESIAYENPYYRYLYEWDNDTIISREYHLWDIDLKKWRPFTRDVYTYMQDTTIIDFYDYEDSIWQILDSEWYIYSSDSFGNDIEVHGNGRIGEVPYTHMDSLMNWDKKGVSRFAKNFIWDGEKYQLQYLSSDTYTENCNYQGIEYLSRSSGKINGTKSELIYVLRNGKEIPTGTRSFTAIESSAEEYGYDWQLTYFHIFYSDSEDNSGIPDSTISYSLHSELGRKTVYKKNENQQLLNISYFEAKDQDPTDGLNWIQITDKTNIYNENQKIEQTTYQEYDALSGELKYTKKETYNYDNDNLEIKISGDFDGVNFTLTDSLLNYFDNDGYNTKTVGFSYENKQISEGFRYYHLYGDSDYEGYCNISFAGDTIIVDGKASIEAELMGEVQSLIWTDSLGIEVSNEVSIVVTNPGIYYLKGSNKGCNVEGSVKIWLMCHLDILGDTLLIANETELTASMQSEEVINYYWYNEAEELIGQSNKIEVFEPGDYAAYGIGDYCFGTDRQAVFEIVTEIEKINLQQSIIEIYPNPSSSKIMISFNDLLNEEIEIKLISNDGKVVKEETVNSAEDLILLDISEVKSGLYILKFEGTDIHDSKKILVK